MFFSLIVCIAVFCLAIRSAFAQYTVTAVAGIGTAGWTGDGGPATSAKVNIVTQIWTDTTGVFFADGLAMVVRRVDNSGIITTIGGTGTGGVVNAGGAFTSVKLNTPWGVVGDTAGTNLYIGDSHHVWKYNRANGIVSILAGTSTQGVTGDGGPATSAQVFSVGSMWLTTSNILYLTEYGNQRVRTINLGTGIISTIAGGGGQGFAGDGGPAASTSTKLSFPQGVYVDTNGKVFIADRDNKRIRLVVGGIISTFAGGGPAGNSADGFAATNTVLSTSNDVKGDSMGNIFVCEVGSHKIRVIDYATNIVTTYLSAGLFNPRTMRYDLTLGKFYVGTSLYLKQADSLYEPIMPPTTAPSTPPSAMPSVELTTTPSVSPSANPTVAPSADPTANPTVVPTVNPSTATPTVVPTAVPTHDPAAVSAAPTVLPTAMPSAVPSNPPSVAPSGTPTRVPSVVPTTTPSVIPTVVPTANPSTAGPTVVPTIIPTQNPAAVSVAPSDTPTRVPSVFPTVAPSVSPSVVPTANPSTATPTVVPTIIPTQDPAATVVPTPAPTTPPSFRPTENPTQTSDAVIPPSKQSSSSSSKSLSNGAVAGVVVGVVAGLLLCGVMVFMLLSRRKQFTKVYVKSEAEVVSK